MKKNHYSFLGAVLLGTHLAVAPLAATETAYDTVILGGGVGGLTAALYLARAGITPLVIEGDTPGGALSQSPKVQNWPGELTIPGALLVDKIRTQAKESGAQFLAEQVVDVDFSQKPFTITTQDPFGQEKIHNITAQTAIVAMGSHPRFLGVPGEREYWSKGVHSCVICDGPLYRDKVVAVVGGGDAAITEAHYLSDIAKKVFVIVRGKDFKTAETMRKESMLAKSNIEVLYESAIQEIQGDGEEVTSITLQGTQQGLLSVDALFLAIGAVPNSALLKDQIELDEKGFIVLKHFQETSTPGVYAVGDIADPIFQQAVSAAGDGAKAALQTKSYLSSLPVAEKVALPQAMESSQASIIDIQSSAEYDRETKNSALPILVDFYAVGCGPCQQFAPVYEELARAFAGKIKFLKVNIEKNEELTAHYQVKGLPSVVILDRKGNFVSKKVRTQEVTDWIKALYSLREPSADQAESFLIGR